MNPTEALYRAWKAQPESPDIERALYNALTRWSRHIVWTMLHRDDPDLTADIVHDALMKAETHFESRSAFTTWFHRVAVRECLMRLRSNRTRPEASLDGMVENGFEAASTTHNPTASLELDELDLSGDDAEMVRGLLEGESLIDIGKRLGLTDVATRVRWLRLRERLRDARGQ